MEKGTIIYVGGFELPDKNAAAHRAVNNSKIFRDLGYRVVLIDREINEAYNEQENCFGFERWSIKKSNEQLYSIKSVCSILNKYNNVLAVIAYNYPAIALQKLKKYCQKHRIKIIADVTEWYGPQGDNIIHRVIKGIDSYFRMNVIQPKLDGVIAISRYLENYYKNKTNTVFVPPLTDLSEEKWNVEPYEAVDNRLRIIYAGSPGKHKDKLNLILRALKDCDTSKIIFRVIGITSEQYLTYYPEDKKLLAELEDCVCFLGRKSHLDVIKELKSADFSLFYREVNRVTMAGFPTKFSEAISCGVPVITNRTSDLKDYLVDGVNGYWIDDINSDLKRILSIDVPTLKAVKNSVGREQFDYRKYCEPVKRWSEKLNGNCTN